MKALALVDGIDHVCCRYRIRAFEKALHLAGCELTLQALSRTLAGRVAQLAQAGRYDAVILQRKLLPRWQMSILRRSSRHLVFDFDDAVLFRDSYDPRGPTCPRRAARFAATVRLADCVLAGNDFLAGCALRAGAEAARVRVLPTCINVERYPPRAREAAGAGLDLVWIGSSSTLQGLELQRPLWDRIAAEVAGVRLRVICDRFPELGRMPVVKVTWNEATEAEDLSAGDVGISWLPDDLWSRGKCGLKVLQYQACSLPVLANPVGVHLEMVDDGRTGCLLNDANAWVEAIQRLAADPALRRGMGAAARAGLVANYSVEAWSANFVAAVTGRAAGDDSRRPTSSRWNLPRHAQPLGSAASGRIVNS